MARLGRITALLLLLLASCAQSELRHQLADLSPGDAGSGEKLFLQARDEAPPCASCHSIDGSQSLKAAPDLQGFAARAGSRVEGQSAQEYAFSSIVRPASYVVPGYANSMYANYDRQLADSDLADLIAYLLTL
ncbi:MAG: cytochrome c [Anaerolineae bacterium]|nr:cytochrome c [Anaerolineae bacterium]